VSVLLCGPGDLEEVRQEATWRRGGGNLALIGRGIRRYRDAHEGATPSDLETLLRSGYLGDPKVLVDPNDLAPAQPGVMTVKCSYEYVGALPPAVPEGVIICYARKGIYPDHRIVLHADGVVEWVGESSLHGDKGIPRTSLHASYEAVVKAFGNGLTEERRAELREFYGIAEEPEVRR